MLIAETPSDSQADDAITYVTFGVNRNAAKVVSVAPIVNTDEELTQLEPWIEACLILSDLIRPAKRQGERAAA